MLLRLNVSCVVIAELFKLLPRRRRWDAPVRAYGLRRRRSRAGACEPREFQCELMMGYPDAESDQTAGAAATAAARCHHRHGGGCAASGVSDTPAHAAREFRSELHTFGARRRRARDVRSPPPGWWAGVTACNVGHVSQPPCITAPRQELQLPNCIHYSKNCIYCF